MRQGVESGDAHPLLLVVATRALLPLALVVGVYIFLRGHNQPGGGFIAGLIVAIALLMQYMASGYAWSAAAHAHRTRTRCWAAGVLDRRRSRARRSFLFGRPFLTSTFGYFHIPFVGEFEIASAMAFDLGVFLTVVGTVMLAHRADLARRGACGTSARARGAVRHYRGRAPRDIGRAAEETLTWNSSSPAASAC